MDKKEILDILDNAKDERGDVPMRLVRQALDKLPTIQPVATDINVGDIISRQAAIDALDCINEVEEVLRSLPSAQPERKKGKWINKDGGLATCSACGERWGVWSVMNYCPNCGADMRGEQE